MATRPFVREPDGRSVLPPLLATTLAVGAAVGSGTIAASAASGDPSTAACAAGGVLVAALRAAGRSRVTAGLVLAQAVAALLVAAGVSAVLLQIANGLGGTTSDGLGVLAGAVCGAVVLWALGADVRPLRRQGVVVLGSVPDAAGIASTLHAGGAHHLAVVGNGLDANAAAVLARLQNAAYVVHCGGASARDRGEFEALDADGIRTIDRAELYERELGVVPLDAVEEVRAGAPAGAGRRASLRAKRALDVAVSLLVLPFAGPVMLVAAFLVRLDGAGPALFRQERVGLGGRPFTILKLRSMKTGGADWSGPQDTRVTRVGRVLRRTHVDELPQLLNVLRGDMSLVGPRPEQVWIAQWLETEIPGFHLRDQVRPGLTGWARLRCGYGRTVTDSAVKLGNDLYYVRNHSLWLDLAILVDTVRMFWADTNQYENASPIADAIVGDDGDRLAAVDMPDPAEAIRSASRMAALHHHRQTAGAA